MSAKDIILNVKIEGANEQLNTLSALQVELNGLAQQKKELNAANKELEESIKAGSISEEEAAKSAQNLAAQQVELSLVTKETRGEYSEAERALLNQGKAMDVAEGSIASMRLELSAAQKEYINLSAAERENEDVGGKLQLKIKAQSDELKALEKDIGITSRSVGDYGQALEGALPLMGGFGSQIQMVIGTLGQIKTSLAAFGVAMKGSAASTGLASGALKGFRVALIATGIGAVVLLLASLIAAFTSTQEGIDRVKDALAPLKENFQAFIGFLQKTGLKVFDGLKKAFDNPLESIKNLAKAINGQLLNSVKGAVNVLRSTSDLIVGTFKVLGLKVKQALAGVPILGSGIDQEALKKDLATAKANILKASKELKTAAIQTVTTMDAAQQKAASNFVARTKQEIAIATERANKMRSLEKQIEIAEINLNRERKKGELIFERQREILNDTNNTEAERIKAGKAAVQSLKDVEMMEKAQLDRKIELMALSHEANDTSYKEQKEYQDLIAEKDKLEGETISKSLRVNKMVQSIQNKAIADQRAATKKAEEEKKKAEAEALKDFLDNEKAKTEAQNKRYDTEIASLEQNRALESLVTTETAEQKFAKEVELQKQIADLKLKQAQFNSDMELKLLDRKLKEELALNKITQEQATEIKAQAKVLEDEKMNALELENSIALNTILREEKDRQTELDIESEAKKEEQIKEIRSNAINAIDQAQQIIFDNQNRRIDATLKREIDALTLRRQTGVISEEEYNKERLKLEKEAFDKKKRIDTAQAIINGALAITRIAADVPKSDYGIATAILIGAQVIQTAAQVGAIQSQKFAKGGLLVGASHANGGIKTSVGGQSVEFEGGEAIINKVSTAKHYGLLSAINQDGGGVPIPSPTGLRKFQNGGILSSSSDLSSIKDDITEGVINAIGSIKVVNVASETTEMAGRVNQIKNISTF